MVSTPRALHFHSTCTFHISKRSTARPLPRGKSECYFQPTCTLGALRVHFTPSQSERWLELLRSSMRACPSEGPSRAHQGPSEGPFYYLYYEKCARVEGPSYLFIEIVHVSRLYFSDGHKSPRLLLRSTHYFQPTFTFQIYFLPPPFGRQEPFSPALVLGVLS